VAKMEIIIKKQTEKVDYECSIIGVQNDAETKLNKLICKKEDLNILQSVKYGKNFKAEKGNSLIINYEGSTYLFWGLGDKKDVMSETIRCEWSNIISYVRTKFKSIIVDLSSFTYKNKINEDKAYTAICEATYLCSYKYDKYKTQKSDDCLSKVFFQVSDFKNKTNLHNNAKDVSDSINLTRDFINHPPNYLTSEKFAKLVSDDIKENLVGVKTKILDKKNIVKEKMGLFLSVNAGSGYEPRLVHLTYTPKKVTKNTKHVALVGKGITFDTGGYSLKPSGSMVGMKFDMGGAATVYGAFRAAVLLNSTKKITCVLAMTDNAVNSFATMPDAVVKGRSGKTVEILNTDAEGRLILADALDYTCDLAPDEIIDAATLTGACLVAVGADTCAVLGNEQKLINNLIKQSKETSESMWQLPITEEHKKDLNSKIADLKNIGGNRYAGTSKAAAFLKEFVKNDIPWAHLDIAGIASDQSHLPYCPPTGASGLMVRTLAKYLISG
jgi:leucyl aminopeptidase